MTDASDMNSMGLVQADIEQARHELQQTVDELADRLNPKHRVDEALDAVEEAAQRTLAEAQDRARHAVDELKQLRTMTPEEATDVVRSWVDEARRWLEDDRHRKLAAGVAGVVVLLVARRRRRHHRR